MGLDMSKQVGDTWESLGVSLSRVMSPDGVLEDRYAYDSGDVIYQRDCDREGCEGGLMLAPARFCGRCNGSGYLVRVDRANSMPEGIPPMIRDELAEGRVVAGASRTAADEYFDEDLVAPKPERATFADRVIGGLPDPNAAYPPADWLDGAKRYEPDPAVVAAAAAMPRDGIVEGPYPPAVTAGPELLEFRDQDGQFVFKIMRNGRVQLGPDVDLNEAGKQFWAAVAGWSPMVGMAAVAVRLDEMAAGMQAAAEHLDEHAPASRLDWVASKAYAAAYEVAARMVREALQ